MCGALTEVYIEAVDGPTAVAADLGIVQQTVSDVWLRKDWGDVA
jgi:hypothetical protein